MHDIFSLPTDDSVSRARRGPEADAAPEPAKPRYQKMTEREVAFEVFMDVTGQAMPDGADLDALLVRHFGFPGFRTGQREVIASVLAGRDTVAVMRVLHVLIDQLVMIAGHHDDLVDPRRHQLGD